MKQLYISITLLLLSISVMSRSLSDTSFSHLEKRAKFFLQKAPDHDSAFKFIEEGLTLSRKRNDSLHLGFFYYLKGRLYNQTEQNLALEYLFRAKEIFSAMKDSSRLAGTYKLIGSLDIVLTPDQRSYFLKESVRILEKINDTQGLVHSYNDLGSYYLSLCFLDSSLYFSEKSLQLLLPEKNKTPFDMATLAGLYNNIGAAYKNMGNHQQALEYYQRAFATIPTESNADYSLNIQQNLMNMYLMMGMTDSAFFYFNNLKEKFSHRPDLQKTAYINLSEFYERNGQLSKALHYYKKAYSVEKILLAKNQVNAVNLMELEYDSRIKKEQLATMHAEAAKAENIRLSLIIGLCLTTLFFSVYLFQQKQKARKKRALLKAEKRVLDLELKNAAINRKYLNEELKYTNKELTSFATRMVQNQRLLNDIREQIVDANKEKDLRKMREKLREINMMLLQVFKDNKKYEGFIEKSRKINHSLIFYLKSHFSQLTEGDIDLLILMFLNFNLKEISVLYNIEPTSVKMKRYRIRKKLGMEPDDSFKDFFSKAIANTELKHTG